MKKLDEDNILLMTDSYKLSHYKQYPKHTQKVYSYFESRGGKFDGTVFFGLQYFLKKYLEGQVVTQERIDEAELIVDMHMGKGMFNREGWEHILHDHGGKLPVQIAAVPEGTVVPVSNVLMTIENTCVKCYWVTNYLETLLVETWYPTTVATISFRLKQLIGKYLEETGDPAGVDFKLHDFGFRGVSSPESAGIGGLAHLVNFMGTDTVRSLVFANNYYNETDSLICPGFSIPASEHSTITSWGKDNEAQAMMNMLEQYDGVPIIACVSDSFDIFKACSDLWGGVLKEAVLKRCGGKGVLVVRPDSGYPPEIVIKCLELLGEKFGTTTNAKGFKVLHDQVRIIQGDGCDFEMIDLILKTMKDAGWSADNIAFGMGGGLLQKLDRDTQKFAFKCSQVVVDACKRDVYKDPITDPGKTSKAGKLNLQRDEEGKLVTVRHKENGENLLKNVFWDGNVLSPKSFDEIRAVASAQGKTEAVPA